MSPLPGPADFSEFLNRRGSAAAARDWQRLPVLAAAFRCFLALAGELASYRRDHKDVGSSAPVSRPVVVATASLDGRESGDGSPRRLVVHAPALSSAGVRAA